MLLREVDLYIIWGEGGSHARQVELKEEPACFSGTEAHTLVSLASSLAIKHSQASACCTGSVAGLSVCKDKRGQHPLTPLSMATSHTWLLATLSWGFLCALKNGWSPSQAVTPHSLGCSILYSQISLRHCF